MSQQYDVWTSFVKKKGEEEDISQLSPELTVYGDAPPTKHVASSLARS
jgi:hypothetical protein